MDQSKTVKMNKMKEILNFLVALIIVMSLMSCEDDIRNIAGDSGGINPNPDPEVSEVKPVNINTEGFDLLEKMQGHWVGINRVIADDYDWFAFDYRPISASHIHGIFEGGSGGNLLTSFFITDFKDTRTIMARNGGVLNGIYRTSYFVLDSVRDESDGKYFRLVDAKGGEGVMHMELRFTQDSLYWNAYTSRLGVNGVPTRHMTFKGTKEHVELAQEAAIAVGFPQNTPAWDFSQGLNEDYLYVNPGDPEAKSASFLAQQTTNDVFSLAQESGDPWRIDEHPYLGYLQIDVERNPEIENKILFINLSRDALTDDQGYFVADESVYNTVLLFPGLYENENQFLVTYLHPGTYYITVVADLNEDGFISLGDMTHAIQKITIDPEGQHQITIDNINVQN